ncbi:pyridoxal phosphate-dependent decarboxylase family protein [Amycolatopsis sp. NPDC049868]|uniref:pyridoxal phosphate-dependent decarboxylase family protein n=1 Tax=Amycolatopsis sp. NPDC049868 TaxID=3363934 RepID=UPI0037BA5B4F
MHRTQHSVEGPLAIEPDDFRRELIRAANWVADYLDAVPASPVTRPLPQQHRRYLSASPLRDNGQPLSGFLDFIDTDVAAYPGGNGHPAFFAWITTPPAPIGILAHLIGTTLNASCGYGENALVDMERGAVRALADLAGLSPRTGGVLTSGGSMANLLCLAAARTWFLNSRDATDGVAHDEVHARLVCYQSTETHMSVTKAARTMGLPLSRIRHVPVTADLRMDLSALRTLIEADLAAGRLPFCVVSNLGTVGTGAIDQVSEISRICAEHGMWHHGDGAYGGLGNAHPDLAPYYEGVSELDSLTVDPHKVLNVPIACGAALVTDPNRLRAAFSTQASYLDGNDEWPWLSESTLELTRPGGRALSVWAVLQQLGREGVRDLIEHYLSHARLLRELVRERPDLELITEGPWAITCFRYSPRDFDGDIDGLTARIASELQDGGKAFLATVRVHGVLTLRASVCGHRTTKADIEILVTEVIRIGKQLTAR